MEAPPAPPPAPVEEMTELQKARAAPTELEAKLEAKLEAGFRGLGLPVPPPLMEEMAGTEAALRPDRTSCSKGPGFGQPRSSVAPRAGAPECPQRRVCAGGPSAIVLRMNIFTSRR